MANGATVYYAIRVITEWGRTDTSSLYSTRHSLRTDRVMQTSDPRMVRSANSFINLMYTVKDQDRDELRKRADQMQQTDGEGWAIGALLLLMCYYTDRYEEYCKD